MVFLTPVLIFLNSIKIIEKLQNFIKNILNERELIGNLCVRAKQVMVGKN